MLSTVYFHLIMKLSNRKSNHWHPPWFDWNSILVYTPVIHTYCTLQGHVWCFHEICKLSESTLMPNSQFISLNFKFSRSIPQKINHFLDPKISHMKNRAYKSSDEITIFFTSTFSRAFVLSWADNYCFIHVPLNFVFFYNP